MKLRKAYRYRLYPTLEQLIKFAKACGCARFVWNKALFLQKGRLDGEIPLMQYEDLAKLLTLWRASDEYGFLAECPVHTQQWSLKFLQQAIWEGLDPKNPKEFPKFRKKWVHNTLRYPDSKQIHFDHAVKDDQGRNILPKVFLPKIGFVKFLKSREIEGTIKNITVTKDGKHWYISVQTEQNVEAPICKSQQVVGIDLGVVRFATLSSEEVIEPLAMKDLEEKMSWEQRKLSRKEKFSENWKQQRKCVQKVYTKKANITKDFHHKHSTEISKNHAIVVMEDLNVSNMTASAKGTLEEPGTNVKAKSGLNKSILRQGWYSFRQMMSYKLDWNGGKLILINPRNTSRECPECRCIDGANRKSQSEFECIRCCYQANADLVASKNILRAGLAQFACCFA
jgi:putative transposase